MKYIIIGRTATGKTHIADMLAMNGLSVLKTTTTRPRRSLDDDACHFITQAEADLIPDDDKLMKTTRNGVEYFTNLADVMAADVCVLDPNGFKEIVKLLPDEAFTVVYAICVDSAAQKIVAIDRADDPVAEAAIFAQRQVDEDVMFGQWEKDLATKTTFGLNTLTMFKLENDYLPETAQKMLMTLIQHERLFKNMNTIVKQAMRLGFLTSSKPDCVDVTYLEPSIHTESLPVERFTEVVLASAEGLNRLMTAWLSLNVDIPEPLEMVDMELACVEQHEDMFADEDETLPETPEDAPEDVDQHDDVFSEKEDSPGLAEAAEPEAAEPEAADGITV